MTRGSLPIAERLAGLPVLLGAGAEDAWVDGDRIAARAAWFRSAGAVVEVIGHPGDLHDISPRQRLRARELLLGTRSTPGSSGFGNTLESEALAGALPRRQNSPRRPPFGLYAEQLNGSGFTSQRADNQRTWCSAFARRPSVVPSRRSAIRASVPRSSGCARFAGELVVVPVRVRPAAFP